MLELHSADDTPDWLREKWCLTADKLIDDWENDICRCEYTPTVPGIGGWGRIGDRITAYSPGTIRADNYSDPKTYPFFCMTCNEAKRDIPPHYRIHIPPYYEAYLAAAQADGYGDTDWIRYLADDYADDKLIDRIESLVEEAAGQGLCRVCGAGPVEPGNIEYD